MGDVPNKQLWYLDSSHGNGAGHYCPLIRHYLAAEFKKLNLGIERENTFDWALDGVDWKNLPIQTDGYSCWPFVLSFIEALLEDTPMTYTNADMKEVYRQYVARMLLDHWRKPQHNEGANTNEMANYETSQKRK